MRKFITILIFVLLSTMVAQGQIKIGGNVYGGGNHANVEGSTKVTVKAGDIGAVMDPSVEGPLDDPQGKVFGGARMADVGGNAFVNVDGANATGYMVINYVYGGNDVAGTIGTKPENKVLPAELTQVKRVSADETDDKKNAVDSSWDSYVRVSTKETNAEKVYIGQLFAGGNGEFTYTDENGAPLMDGDDYIVKDGNTIIGKRATPFSRPELDKAYLEVVGGSIVYAYGGGNNATVKEKTVIYVDNPSEVVNHVYVDNNGIENKEATEESHDGSTDLLSTARFKEMGINTGFSFPSSDEFQIGRFFGGNNQAEMAIRPTWNLQSGKIRNLYSGGNKGNMTCPEGLLLEIPATSTIIVDNIFGGCRMADVMPTKNGVYTPCMNLTRTNYPDAGLTKDYNFPDQLSARVLVSGGDINNVYGGNDVTGTVYGGNAIGIYKTVRGDVYGGGNGAYPYTDNETYENHDVYGDFLYNTSGYNTSIEALNAFRPNAEQVSIRLKGTDAEHPTIIKGSVFVGGNCASLATKKDKPRVELKIGSYVLADKVFLGNNGEKMVDEGILQRYAGTYEGTEGFSSLSSMKTDASLFASYMEGVVMNLLPSVVFDNTAKGDPDNYEDYTSKIGSFYCGGNIGSMAIAGKNTFSVDRRLVIFDKFVAGCNNADVKARDGLNPAYEGGILGATNERGSNPGEYYTDDGTKDGHIKDRIELSLDNVVVEPRRWDDTFTAITSGTLTPGQEYYKTNLRSSAFIADGSETPTAENPYYELTTKGDQLDWNTALWSVDEDDFLATDSTNTANDRNRRLLGGNVYGGCYNSGHVNGNVIINVNQDLIIKKTIFAVTDGIDNYTISGERHSGVLLEAQGDDTQSVSMSVFGGGYGENTEIWGSTTVNLNNGYVFQAFGGGEEGVVGKKNSSGEYGYNAAYSSTVNLKGANAGYSETESGLPLAEAEYIYGGGSEGDVIGNTYVYLGNGRVYDAFGGASNADIYGGSEVHIGYGGGFPWVRDNIYGGNDFGGTIKGQINHTTATSRTPFDSKVLSSATYVKYIQGRVDSIFGGNYGSYNYADRVFKDYTDDSGAPKEGFSFPHLDDNSFVHFVPADNSNNVVGYIFGGSEGYAGHHRLNNSMQQETYVLIDDTKTKDANRFANVDIYGGGAFAGTGTSTSLGAGRTAVDLYGGSFHNVYGGCNQEGLVGYTRVNVPSDSKIKANAIFGGGKGYNPTLFDTKPELAARYCDHYVTCVDYQGENAIVNDAIYGGNENSRIACDTYINITAPVMQSNGYQATIYGAGYGKKTISGRTNVFMNNGSNAYKVFGGGRDGNAINYASMKKWLIKEYTNAGTPSGEIAGKVTEYRGILERFGTYLAANPITLPENTGTYVNETTKEYDGTYTNDILPEDEVTQPDYHQTNVHIMNGGNVSGYAYGGGLGTDAVVAGTTYIELKGGNVDRDIYGGGQGGPVFDEHELGTGVFTCETNVYIEGGMARNVYGGGYLGHVGKHCKVVDGKIVEAAINESVTDIPAVANVTIGKVDGTSFYNGIPAITRNVYGGGEGGSVYGTANLTINNGYIGYRYKNTATSGSPVYEYVEELDDQKPNAIEKAGNAFGGGYVVNSYVDNANVEMYGGQIRGSLYGGGEVGPIGRGTMKDGATGGIENGKATIYKAGKTSVKMYDGHVLRNVFGGGRGHDSWGGDGTKYMDEALIPTLDMKCKGYVFGQTEVDIYGGEIGTDEGVALGYGNVFGGGDIGCVYSAYELADGTLCIGKKEGTRYTTTDEGYYYKAKKNGEGYSFLDDNGNVLGGGAEKHLTEDCKVLVEPWCKANSAITINETSYAAGEYVPTSALNYLGNKEDANWTTFSKEDVNKEGIIIHNAVFAGGNTSPGSTEVYANTTTVFGNATASIHDVYNRDLISIGRGRVGGLYGDGNLTLVDGYREVNITNYGTDYYHINPEITIEQYRALPNREAAYYEIRYKCLIQCSDKNGKTYAVGSTITADEMVNVFDGVTVGEPAQSMIGPDGKPLAAYWEENGVCSRYAGRPMNTVQRSDFCGVFGSRMVMQGAQDRVPEVVDYTNYTINRVREVSLNKKISVRPGDAGDDKNKEHGNYFGIYSVVNYLGALTSDVDFHTAVRVTDNSDATTYKCKAGESGPDYGMATYHDWKEAFHNERKRNNGNSHNKLALASGVYLELTNETGTGNSLYEKDWGLITGVVELDLINVQPGMGGGYVYAKNAHGIRESSGKTHTILTSLNKGAVTNKQFQYNENEETKKEWETSGNFVHSTQTIIDDCYNIGAKYHTGYNKPDGVPAHYWFIKGAVYIYDQYISAYTGSPNAFSEEVSIPLTITSASHGKMTLMDVQPNHYAYYLVNTNSKQTPLGENDKIELRDKEYGRNDAINYWDYSQLTAAEKALFVDETYVVTADCTYGDGATPVTYKAGTVLLPSEYKSLKENAPKKDLDEDDELSILTPYVHHVSKDQDVDFDFVFRSSNNVSHNTGYILTYTIDNPNQWNTWYSKADGDEPKNQTGGTGFEDGPTYTPTNTGLYGQNDYTIGSIISKEVYDTYQDVKTNHSSVIPSTGQAEFYPAYIVTADLLETTNKSGTTQHLHKGATLAAENYSSETWSSMSGSVAAAYVVNTTVQLTKTEFMYRGTYLTADEITTLKSTYGDKATEIDKAVSPAYYCATAGLYGGNYYEKDKNYRALAAYSAMSESDRENFTFNYDALDLLIDPNYSKDPTTGNVIHADAQKYQYDSEKGTLAGANANSAHYSLQTKIDYTATYNGKDTDPEEDTAGDNYGKKYMTVSTDIVPSGKVYVGQDLERDVYESLPNEQYHWTPITVNNTDDPYYVVTKTIVLGDTPYAAGQVITKDTYDGLGAGDKEKVKSLTFTSPGTYYYCREAYTISNNADGHAVTSATGVTGGTGGNYEKGQNVSTGVVITDVTYNTLTNQQKNFSIHGLAPTETSTLFVARNSDIYDLSAEKIITVIYQYDYVESDMSGTHITPVSERHILNIHLNFKSGIPTVEDILQPDIVLPGTTISIPEPYVTPGAYEITGGGWKLFDTETDAESHINGVEITPTTDPLYLYQDGHYLAYYAKTYLGETYSNHVPVSVANYHDLKKVMDDTNHHYYIDHREIFDRLKVEPKIYINDYSGSSQNGLDLFKNLYDLSLLTNSPTESSDPLYGHNTLNERVKGGNKLEFFLRTDIAYTDNPETDDWTPIGTDDVCFKGTLHGDGHTISGLDHSLFYNLCGNVYNLGVTGSFKSAGVVDKGSGYVESAWVKTTNTTPLETKPYAVFGNPTDVGYQVVNSYYYDGNNDLYNTTTTDGVTTSGGERGKARAMSAKEFYNGTVAYNLNNFYLHKRYANKKGTETADTVGRYYTIADDGSLKIQNYKSYANKPELCSSGYVDDQSKTIKYVEERFKDGDFRYAGGTIPEEADERQYIDTKDDNKVHFFPIWPDDYLFFGQKLTYGWAVTEHQEVPTAVVRNKGRLSQLSDANRVYRAPAYFRSKDMGMAYFNPEAYLAQKSNDGTKTAYPGMTAIDFAGHYDTDYILGQAYRNGQNWISEKNDKQQAFYPPLLDDDGLLSIINCDETRNLLIYAPAESAATGYANKATYDVLTGYFTDPAYGDYYNIEGKPEKYRTVADVTKADPPISIYGHLVKATLTNGYLTATNDHLLVDKEDFNCPIRYLFDGTHRMWYQRKPEDHEYVDFTKGWQGISIPFTAELVTTDDKGEITHFYSGSETSKNGTNTKIGHEYWLRELTGITKETVDETEVAKASFTYPNATGDNKTVSNTFLWDYYYKNTTVHNQKDANDDTYQTYYENNSRNYTSYPLLTAGIPYIIGLPGETYYEFDLSGTFEAKNTAVAIGKLGRQTITFASDTGVDILVSDDETKNGVPQTYSGTTKNFNFTFKPSYMNESLAAGTNNYTLDNDGDSYDKVPGSGDATKVSAFRPYFTITTEVKSSSPKSVPQSIIFGNDYSSMEGEPQPALDGDLKIYVKDHKIYTTSYLKEATTIRITNVAGITFANYVLQPGETVETPVQTNGVYIVNRKKLLVK